MRRDSPVAVVRTLNLYSYCYYDPGWHRYEPTQADVLTDLQVESRRKATARGISRVLLRLPWPVLVIPPFVLRVSSPVAAVALVFGVLSSWAGVPPTYR
jgi:hypothetical protein